MIHLLLMILSACGVAASGWFVYHNHNVVKDVLGLAFGSVSVVFGALQIGGLVQWIKLIN
jgi:hypothetical protein